MGVKNHTYEITSPHFSAANFLHKRILNFLFSL